MQIYTRSISGIKICRRGRCLPARPRRTAASCYCSNKTYESLERAVQTINKAISLGSLGSKKVSVVESGNTTASQRKRSKLVAFTASLQSNRPVKESKNSSKSLQAYLSLPIEQYSVLDPRWITRGDDGKFHVQLPLFDIVGVDLTPGVSVSVEVDAASQQVRFTADSFTLGDPKLDKEFTLSMLAILSSKSLVKQSNQDQSEVASSQLHCSVDVNMSLQVPHPLSIAPRPLLATTGGLVMHMALQQLLPSFLEMLVVDYTRWMEGTGSRDAPAGSLLPSSS